MALTVIVGSGTLASGAAALRGDRPFTVQVPSMGAGGIAYQFTPLPATSAVSADFMTLMRDDGTGVAYVAYSGGGNIFTAPLAPVTGTMRLLLSAAVAAPRSFAIFPVQLS
jgi:hypothetical protein